MKTTSRAIIKAASTQATVRTYLSGKGTVSHLTLSAQLIAKAGLKAKNLVSVRLVKIVAPNGSHQLAVEIERDPTGVIISSRRSGILLQKINLFPKKTPSMMMTVLEAKKGRLVLLPLIPSNDNRLNAVVDHCPVLTFKVSASLPPEFLDSLSIDQGWPARKRMLGAHSTARKTPAGDQCYTAWFILERVLKAANRKEFDIDVCSMQANGRYDLTIPKITDYSWGSVPEQFRNDKQVLQAVPAKRYFTNDRPYGSLGRDWKGDLIWLNPPYTNRAWATFLECAHHQVDKGHAGIVVALVPCDNTGAHGRHLYSQHAYQIEIIKNIPFFKKEKINKKEKTCKYDIIDVIKGNQFVVFGKGPKVQKFLRKFLRELLSIDYISEQHLVRYEELFGLREKRTAKRNLRKAA